MNFELQATLHKHTPVGQTLANTSEGSLISSGSQVTKLSSLREKYP